MATLACAPEKTFLLVGAASNSRSEDGRLAFYVIPPLEACAWVCVKSFDQKQNKSAKLYIFPGASY